jgi:ABC-type dipeptide/oligopeptide/nickel transport system permease subunit
VLTLALSFLGFGVQVPLAGPLSAGALAGLPPGLMILLTVLYVVLLADGRRDALDPRLSKSK